MLQCGETDVSGLSAWTRFPARWAPSTTFVARPGPCWPRTLNSLPLISLYETKKYSISASTFEFRSFRSLGLRVVARFRRDGYEAVIAPLCAVFHLLGPLGAVAVDLALARAEERTCQTGRSATSSRAPGAGSSSSVGELAQILRRTGVGARTCPTTAPFRPLSHGPGSVRLPSRVGALSCRSDVVDGAVWASSTYVP